jgi:hypothetical protein
MLDMKRELDWGPRLKPFIVPAFIVGTAIALILFPMADCVACEGARPWGRDDGAYAVRSTIFDVWLISAPFFVGFFRLRLGWTVPLAIVIGGILTEPLAGVAQWSLVDNEGPTLVLTCLPVGFAAFIAGKMLGQVSMRNSQPGKAMTNGQP